MLIDALARQLRTAESLQRFWDKLDRGDDGTLAVAASARPLLVAARFALHPQSTLVVVAGEEAAHAVATSLVALVGDDAVYRFPAPPKRSGAETLSARLYGLRAQAAWALQHSEPAIVVASAQALIHRLAPPEARVFEPFRLVAETELEDLGHDDIETLDDFKRWLAGAGYRHGETLEGPGTFTATGGTIDVHPAQLSYPVRIDFFGDEVEEIRRITAATGQSIGSMEAVELFPAIGYQWSPELLGKARKTIDRTAAQDSPERSIIATLEAGADLDQGMYLLEALYGKTATLADYTSRETLTALAEPRSLTDDAAHAYDEQLAAAPFPSLVKPLVTEAASLDFGVGQRATFVSIMQAGSTVDADLPIKRVDVAGGEDRLFARLHSFLGQSMTTVLSVSRYRARQSMKLALVDHGLPVVERLDHGQAAAEETDASGAPALDEPAAGDASADTTALRRGVVTIVDTDIPLGMVIPAAKLAIVSILDTQGAAAASRRRRAVDITEITFPFKPGDYVVHAAHGVAFFRSMVRQEVDGSERDYLLLEYAHGDKLYVPVEQLDRVSRYVGPEGAAPRLTRLNTSDWSRAMAKARKATRAMAFDLVELYARRAAVKGYQFSPDTLWQREMEEAFPYELTPDQARAIADVKADMESNRPMDRLICGDVGFGKTEVALRAAFKATQDHKQVMVLCPTTILAQQHYQSFKDRFEPFGVSVEVLSRFRSNAEQRKALEGFSEGKVAVLIGTHRLLSRDVEPHELGLVIIDEEQRFGVAHKEQLKSLRESVDVLTLSATPIPRTMQMALSGVRDMSLILTPPGDRLPVKVYVGEWDPDVVGDAIRRELARGGQVYYVSNRVRTIDDAVERVAGAAGEARIGIAHGKMSHDQLERVMEEFAAGELDVLVATTIIESGIDNPHTNTLIIEDSQRLGLAQMYQLKGRVGRSSVQAYAYFMFPDNIPLTEEATERLVALDEHQDLGSGMRIAMRDLEIRGAGSLLGAEQHGNLSAVGFDLFAEMLSQAVAAAQQGKNPDEDEPFEALSEITVNVPGHAYLSDDYLPEVDERVRWYRRIASAPTVEDVDAVESSLRLAHPEMPEAAVNLFEKARIRALAYEHGVTSIIVAGGRLTVSPVELSRNERIGLRRRGIRYNADKGKLSAPLKELQTDEETTLFTAVAAYLAGLFGKDADAARKSESSEENA